MDCGIFAAHRAFRIFAQLELTELHLQSVKQYQPAHERIALADDELDCFKSLQRSYDPRQYTKHTPFCTARHHPGRWRRSLQTSEPGTACHTFSGCAPRVNHADLSFKPKNAPVHICLPD